MDRQTKAALKEHVLSPAITMFDFVYSETAEYHGINNLPEEMYMPAAHQICLQVLQPVSDHFRKSVKIISGYRSPKLNVKLNGAPNSQHLTCQAVDFKVVGLSLNTVAKWIAEHLDFDLLLLEYEDYTDIEHSASWLHVSYNKGANRRLDLTTEAGLHAVQLSPNFTLWEMVRSATATARKIYNIPDEAGIERLRLVCRHILQPVRNHFNRPVRVNSGYRSPALNRVLSGASKSSQHMKCEAVDFEIMGLDNFDLAQWIAKNLDYDQLILEFYGNNPSDPNDGWVHASFSAKRNRHKDLTINKNGTFAGLKPR
jgi:uncharacterized protein YcbK (DUF882 family)